MGEVSSITGGAAGSGCGSVFPRGMLVRMRVVTGRVENGKVVSLSGTLPEGTVVTIVAPEASDTFELSPEQEVALQRSIAEADRGDVLSADQVLAELRRP